MVLGHVARGDWLAALFPVCPESGHLEKLIGTSACSTSGPSRVAKTQQVHPLQSFQQKLHGSYSIELEFPTLERNSIPGHSD